MVVTETYRVKVPPQPKLAYTVNLYHTKCSILVNGPRESMFVDNDLPQIQSKLKGSDPNLAELNIQLKSAISLYLSKCSPDPLANDRPHEHLEHLADQCMSGLLAIDNPTTPDNKPQVRSASRGKVKCSNNVQSKPSIVSKPARLPVSPIAAICARHNDNVQDDHDAMPNRTVAIINTQAAGDQDDIPEPSDTKCAVCRRNCVTRASYCDQGDHWVHYKCEKLSQQEIEVLEQSDEVTYTCKLCMHLVSEAQAPTQNPTVTVVTGSPGIYKATPDTHGNAVTLAADPITNSDSHEHVTRNRAAPITTGIHHTHQHMTGTNKLQTEQTQKRHEMLAEWDKDLKQRETQLNNRERKVKQQEAEVLEQSLQISSLKSLVLKLESDIKTMKQDNHLLRLAQPIHHDPVRPIDTHNLQSGHYDVVSKLADLVSDMTTHILDYDRRSTTHRSYDNRGRYYDHRPSTHRDHRYHE